MSFGIVVKELDGFEERCADDRIAADTDTSGLADAEAGELIDGFVSESAAAADYADVALLVDAAGHDADFAFPGRDDARAVGADQPRFVAIDYGGDAHHVDDRNALGDADDERNLGVGGFEDGVCSVRRRNEND